LDIINAGGIPPYIRRANGTIESLDLGGFALGQGLGVKSEYQTMTLPLAPDDLVILVSDGVVEAKNPTGQLFGFDRLSTAITYAPTTNAKAMLDHLLAEVVDFVGNAEPHDDLTIVVFKHSTFGSQADIEQS
jgi:serine phosphatase RsbU (regulator of sigma subunit)